MNKKDKEIDSLMLEKVELKKKYKKLEAKIKLDEKTKDMTPDMKAYIETRFDDADSSEIEGQINEAITAFKKKEGNKRRKLVESAKNKSKVKNPKIIKENTNVINEVEKPKETEDKSILSYVNTINKSTKNSAW